MWTASSPSPITPARWSCAQAYEQAYWAGLGDEIEAGTRAQLDWYAWRAARLQELLASAGCALATGDRILEIGSGPVGTVNFLHAGERYAIDPLEHFYQSRPSLVALRRPGVTYLQGTGERLPFESGSRSLVIVDNVIDHTYNPRAILQEVRRVLAQDGRLYLLVNVHTRWGALLHSILSRLRIDKGHPFTFTSATLRSLLASAGFAIVAERIGEYAQARREDLQSPDRRARIKAYTGLSEFTHAVVCR